MRNKKAYPSKEIDFTTTIIKGYTVYRSQNSGMDLRDYFAGKIIQSFIVRDNTTPLEELALSAYEMANIMMEQREK